jgi:uncharacterized protein
MSEQPKPKRGFACMDPEKRRAIAAKGGAGKPDALRSFSLDRELARAAARKGGLASVAARRRRKAAASA